MDIGRRLDEKTSLGMFGQFAFIDKFRAFMFFILEFSFFLLVIGKFIPLGSRRFSASGFARFGSRFFIEPLIRSRRETPLLLGRRSARPVVIRLLSWRTLRTLLLEATRSVIRLLSWRTLRALLLEATRSVVRLLSWRALRTLLLEPARPIVLLLSRRRCRAYPWLLRTKIAAFSTRFMPLLSRLLRGIGALLRALHWPCALRRMCMRRSRRLLTRLKYPPFSGRRSGRHMNRRSRTRRLGPRFRTFGFLYLFNGSLGRLTAYRCGSFRRFYRFNWLRRRLHCFFLCGFRRFRLDGRRKFFLCGHSVAFTRKSPYDNLPSIFIDTAHMVFNRHVISS